MRGWQRGQLHQGAGDDGDVDAEADNDDDDGDDDDGDGDGNDVRRVSSTKGLKRKMMTIV